MQRVFIYVPNKLGRKEYLVLAGELLGEGGSVDVL